MSINERLATMLPDMLARHGFDVTLQLRVESAGGDFDVGSSSWGAVATVRAAWDRSARARSGMEDGGPSSEVTRSMTIAYREDVSPTERAGDFRIVYGKLAYKVLGIDIIGDRVGLRLTVEAGSEPLVESIARPPVTVDNDDITADQQ